MFRTAFLSLFLFHFAAADLPQAAPACLNGSANPKLKFINDFATSKEPMIVAFRESKKSNAASPPKLASALCAPRAPDAFSQAKKWCNQIIESVTGPQAATTPLPGIKAQCLAAALERTIEGDGYLCASDRSAPQYFDNTDPAKKPCIDQEMLEYMQFTINSAIACLSPQENPLDARVLMKKMNNESGFNFYLGKNIGVGIGQLTSDPVQDITGWYQRLLNPKQKKRPADADTKYNKAQNGTQFISGNANEVLENLMKNPNPHCKPFQKILENEAQFPPPPPYPGAKKNYCHWLNPQRGLPRSLIYGIGYFLHNRDMEVVPRLEKQSSSLAKNNDVISALTMISYGRNGIRGAQAWMSTARISKDAKASDVLANLDKNEYLRETENKMAELLDKVKDLKKGATSDGQGDLCIQP